MTKKQYSRRMMELKRKLAKESGIKHHHTDRKCTPIWGAVIQCGSHKGEVLRSYEQAWDCVNEVFSVFD